MKTYILIMKNYNLVKIGKSTHIETRIQQHNTSNPFISDTLIIDGDYESYFHRALSHLRVKNEWFDLSSFNDLDNILETCKGLFSMLKNNRDKCNNDCEAINNLIVNKYE